MKASGKYHLTPQRRAVLDVVKESDEHLTAREIFERAREKRPGLSYATIYNALNYLTQVGLIHEISLGNAASRYDRHELTHGHAMCDRCGKVIDLELHEAAAIIREIAAASEFEPTVIAVMLYGQCHACDERGTDGESEAGR